MIQDAYRFKFAECVDLRDARDTLLLAALATEGLYGEARVRMDAAYAVDAPLQVIVVDEATQVDQDVSGVFTSLLTKEFGPDAFSVRRLNQEGQS
jgi:hypothetical protein